MQTTTRNRISRFIDEINDDQRLLDARHQYESVVVELLFTKMAKLPAMDNEAMSLLLRGLSGLDMPTDSTIAELFWYKQNGN